jgi:hypothetical protein
MHAPVHFAGLRVPSQLQTTYSQTIGPDKSYIIIIIIIIIIKLPN